MRDGMEPKDAPPSRGNGLARLLGALSDQAVELAADALRAAKDDAVRAARQSGEGVGFMVAALCLLMLAIGFLGAAGAVLLTQVMPLWGAIGVIGLVLGLVAGGCLLRGRALFSDAGGFPSRTREAIRRGTAETHAPRGDGGDP